MTASTLTVVSAADLSVDITSSAFTSPSPRALLEVTTTGSPNGTLAVQASVTGDNYSALPLVSSSGVVANTVTITSAKTDTIMVRGIDLFQWLRVVWTAVSGSGTLTVTAIQ